MMAIASIQEMTPEEAFRCMNEGLLYLDVRSVLEFDMEHPTGAFNIPWQQHGPSGFTLNERFLDDCKCLLAAQHPQGLILGCQSGKRSARAAKYLLQSGVFQRVIVEQKGGIEGFRDAFGSVLVRGWKAAALPLTQGPSAGSYAAWTALVQRTP